MCFIALLRAARTFVLSSDIIVVGRTGKPNIDISLSPSPERQPKTRKKKKKTKHNRHIEGNLWEIYRYILFDTR